MTWSRSQPYAVFLILGVMAVAGASLAARWAAAWLRPNAVYLQTDLKALGYFTLDQTYGTVTDVPAASRALDGRRVVLEGFMYDPQATADGRTQVQLVYGWPRAWGGPPLVQERVYSRIPRGDIPVYGPSTFAR